MFLIWFSGCLRADRPPENARAWESGHSHGIIAVTACPRISIQANVSVAVDIRE